MVSLTPSSVTEFWIGLSDVTMEGTFVWMDGSTSTYSNWRPGEPAGGYTEQCVVAMKHTSNKFNDIRCSNGYPYVCATCAQGPCGQVTCSCLHMYVCMYVYGPCG